MESIIYWVWLHNALSFRGNNVKALLGYFDDAKSIYYADDEEINDLSDITPSEKNGLCDKSLSEAKKIIKRCRDIKCRIIAVCDEKYPEKLGKIDDPPAVIFVKGDISHINEPCAAVVGTRNPSLSGKTMAYDCASELSKNGYHIVSGCADGVDTQAHKGALQTGLHTYAVLGGGVNHKYLKKNQLLRNEISKCGALITEYPPDIEPTDYTFPLRDRIISALADCTVVVEASKISVTIITAEYAAVQKKPVFVLCGDYKSVLSDGADMLLENGAWPAYRNDGYADIIKWMNSSEEDKKAQEIDLDAIRLLRRDAKQEIRQAAADAAKERDMHILNLIDMMFSPDTDSGIIGKIASLEYKPFTEDTGKIKKPEKTVVKTKHKRKKASSGNVHVDSTDDNDNKDNIVMLNVTEKIVHNEKKQEKNDDFSADMLTENARAVYDTISDTPIFTDQIKGEVGLSISDVMSSLTELELYGLIVPLPNGKYVRK